MSPGPAAPQPAGSPHPWRVGGGSGPLLQKVRPGSLDGLVPVNIFAELEITGVDVEYIVLEGTMSDGGCTSCELVVSTAPPTPNLAAEGVPPATVYDTIAVLYNGVVYQVRSGNLTSASVLQFEAPDTAPAIGQPNTIPWYRWSLTEAL